MTPDTQNLDFKATFLTLGPVLAHSLGIYADSPKYAGSEILSAAIKRVDLDDDEDEDDEEEEDDFDEEEDSGDEEDDEDEDEDEEEDEDEDDDLDDDEEDDEEEDDEELNLI